MKLDVLLVPISPDTPCGEDLLSLDDPDFVDYYFNVEDRLPASYFDVRVGTLFDSRSVDHRAETAQIDALLKRSRDLRLLGIEAKFQILSGRFKGWADAVLGMIELVRAHPDDVHPRDPVERQNALEELNAIPTIVAPLEYAPLIADRRAGDVVYRAYGIGSGKITPRAGEASGDVNSALSALGSSENIATVDALYQQLKKLRDGLSATTAICQSASQACTPRFTRLQEKLDDIIAMIIAARSDLDTASVDEASKSVEGHEGETDADTVRTSSGQTITITTQATDIADHREAYRALKSLESYFVSTEPASLALILVTQSRILIGRPLVEALDALLENNANSAELNFGTEKGFSLSMFRMRELAGQADIPPNESLGGWQEGDLEAPVILSRDHAAMVLRQIEDFFRSKEPASPIPILLFKARNLLAKDFHALVRELIPLEQ